MAAPVAAELQHLEPSTLTQSSTYRFSPLVSWLVATVRPGITVEMGPGDEASLLSTCEAVLRADAGATCAAVLLRSGSDAVTEDFPRLMTGLTGRFGSALEGYESEEACRAGLRGRTVGLVHLSLFDSDEMALPDLAPWLEAMAPGAVIVVTTTASDASSNFVQAKARIAESYPSVPVSLGLTTEAVVAQRPADDATPIVDMLRQAPFAVGAFLALFGEQIELHQLLQHESEPADAVRALIGRVIDQQLAERGAFVSALRVYQEETARLSTEVAEARRELSDQIEAARREREHLVGEFLDRVDELSSKVAVTAARSAAELAQKNALLEAEERRVEAYAGQAAVAQSVIDDMHRSTSWRVTAPVRLLSRLLAQRAQPTRAEPEN